MKLVFNLEPVSQLRPRFSKRPFIHAYDPPKVAKYKRDLAALGKQKMLELGIKQPLEGALSVDMYFYRPIQKSISKKEHKRRASGEVYPDGKPDSDNYVKSFFDGLNGVVWSDDAQIVDHSAHKRYSDNPRIEVEIHKMLL